MNLPIFKSRYFWFVVSVIFIYKVWAVGIYAFSPQHLSLIWSEGDLGENIGAAAWGLGVVLCLIKLLFFMGKQDKLLVWLWSFFACFLGVTRELDMHKKFGEISGIEWKVDFVSDQSVSLVLKIILILMMVIIIGGMMGSILWNFRNIIRELKAGNVLITIFLMGLVYMSVGFLLDGSVLGTRFFNHFITRSFAKLCEESFETIAAVTACLAFVPFFYKKNAISNNQ